MVVNQGERADLRLQGGHDAMIAERAHLWPDPAVLGAFAGQLSNGEARRLEMELPGFVTEPWPLSARHRSGAHPVPVDEFIVQVSGRTGRTAEETRTGTGAVLAVLRERLGEDGYRHLLAQLPPPTCSWCGRQADQLRSS